MLLRVYLPIPRQDYNPRNLSECRARLKDLRLKPRFFLVLLNRKKCISYMKESV